MNGHDCDPRIDCAICDGLALLAWFEGFQALTKNIPVGAEDHQRGASIWNWHIAFVRDGLKSLENDRAVRRQKLHKPPALCPF
jgi:hypothetical protein